MELNLADLFESVVDAVPDRTALVAGDRCLTYRQLNDRIDRVATILANAGVGPGDFVGIQLPNGSEYLEVMLAAFKVRAVPVNVNYRYVGDELRYLFADAGLVALVHHREYQDAVDSALSAMPEQRLVLSVGTDGSYEPALAATTALTTYPSRSADDLYCVYTGGTTGMPKGVLWRQEDIFFAAMGGGDPYQFGDHVTSADQLPGRIPDPGMVALPAPPFMHAAGHWLAFSILFGGGTVVTLPGGQFNPATLWRLVDEERANIVVIVGDAMARPLPDELEANPGRYELSSLVALGSGGALFSPSTKARFRQVAPNLIIRDAFGASETGQLGGTPPADDPDGSPRLHVDDRTTVLDAEHRPVKPGSGETGHLARGGHVPLGYLGDPEKSAATFVEVDGARWSLPGDLATVEEDGTIVVLGRESQCINTGGEKVYPEEVEAALKANDMVLDTIVVGVKDRTWGQAVCAVVEPRPGSTLTIDDLREFTRGRIANYKLPRHLVLVDQIVRSPSGKPDTRWASTVANEAITQDASVQDPVTQER